MPSRKTALLVGLVLAVILSGTLALRLASRQPREARADVEAPAAPTAPAAPDPAPHSTAVAPLPPPPVSPPLPPAGGPFESVVTELVARAESGDAGAACRLSLELLRCRLAAGQFGGAAARKLEEASQLVDIGAETQAEWVLGEAERNAGVEKACAAVDPALIDRAPQWLRQAALAGDREALRQYVDGRNLFHYSDYGFLTTPEFDLWRREAPRLLRRMLEAGDPQAAIWLAEGYAPGGAGPLQGLIDDDPERARTWLAVAKRLYGPMLGLPLTMPGAGSGPMPASEAADRLHARWFGGRTWSLTDKAVLDLLPNFDPNATDVGTHCGAAP